MKATLPVLVVGGMLLPLGCTTPRDSATSAPDPVAVVAVQMPNVIEQEARLSGAYFSATQVDSAPILVKVLKPTKPRSEVKEEGRAVVEFIVDESGVPTQIQSTEATSGVAARIACEAIARWRFEPATKDGRAVPCRMRKEMIFHVEKDEFRSIPTSNNAPDFTGI